MRSETKKYILITIWLLALFTVPLVFTPLPHIFRLASGLIWFLAFISYERRGGRLQISFFLKAFAVCQAVSGALDIVMFHPCIIIEGFLPTPSLFQQVSDSTGVVLLFASVVFWMIGVFQMIIRIEKAPKGRVAEYLCHSDSR